MYLQNIWLIESSLGVKQLIPNEALSIEDEIERTLRGIVYMALGFVPWASRKKGYSDSQNRPKGLDFVNSLKDFL
ncbi:hypothetical protein L2E82_15466 [Cichorium intybus]|uniref:Uncharacterized protein n=1 Tax=Cichorium intybus TaxID=13427 RepID=A0ACB9F3F6_CICIN|nr:hypothetical protein L2E82_15466 [Cichorium intybus]